MKIEVMGPGCAKCNKLLAVVKQAVEDTGVQAEVEKVEDIKEFAKAGVFLTPALVIDGEVKFSGKVPSLNTLKKLIR